MDNKKSLYESNIKLKNEEFEKKLFSDLNPKKSNENNLPIVKKSYSLNLNNKNRKTNAFEQAKLKEKVQVNLGFFFYLKSSLCKLKNKSDILKNKIFLFMTNFFDEKIDLMFYLQTLNNFDKLKKLFLNETYIKVLELPIKPSVLDEELLRQFDYLKNENDKFTEFQLIEFFRNKVENKCLEPLDTKFLDLFPKFITNKIVNQKAFKDIIE